jgi:HEAT repeats
MAITGFDQKVVERWLERLTRPDGDPVTTVNEINRAAVRVRGAIRTRGGVATTARPEVPSSLEQELDKLTRSGDEKLRGEVAYALGGVGGDVSVRPLCHLALHDPVASVRVQATGSLGRIGGDQAVQALIQAAQGDVDEAVRAEAIDELGLLMRREQEEDLKVRIRGVLAKAATTDVSPFVRERASGAR